MDAAGNMQQMCRCKHTVSCAFDHQQSCRGNQCVGLIQHVLEITVLVRNRQSASQKAAHLSAKDGSRWTPMLSLFVAVYCLHDWCSKCICVCVCHFRICCTPCPGSLLPTCYGLVIKRRCQATWMIVGDQRQIIEAAMSAGCRCCICMQGRCFA